MEIQKGFIFGLLSFSALVFAAGGSIEKWQVQDYWQKLTPRMTEVVVIDLLGEPLEKETVNDTQIWYYQEAPKREGDTIIDRPRDGILRFRVNGSACLLFDWKEQDWTTTTPHTEAQYLAEQKRIETQQKSEELARQREEQQAQRQAETERLRAEREAERLKAAEESKQCRQKQAELRQQQLAENPPRQTTQQKERASGYTLNNGHTKYWFSIAGLFLVMAIGISITFGFKK